MKDTIIRPGDVPTLRVIRDDDGSIEIQGDGVEWLDEDELCHFATWLAPMVDIFADYDEIANAMGAPELTTERMAVELAGTARELLAPAYLVREGGRWRFRGGVCPCEAPKPDWGQA